MGEKKTLVKTTEVGVYYYESSTRRYNGKPDKIYYVKFKDAQRKNICEKVGALSEGINKAYAAAFRRKLMEEMRKGASISKETRRRCFAEVYYEWKEVHLSTLKDTGIAKSIEKHILPLIGEKALKTISPLDIERLISIKQKEGLAAGTIVKLVGTISRIFHKAKDWGLFFGEIPTERVRLPRTDQQRDRYLTPEEAKQLFAALRRSDMLWHDIAMLSLHTGIRLANCLALRGKDIDFSARILNIPQSKGGYYFAVATEECLAMLQSRLTTPDALIFPSPVTGGMLYPHTGKAFLRAVEICGLNAGIDPTDRAHRVCFHTLRHTFASWIVQGNTSTAILRPLLGHKTERMTQRYAKLAPINAQKAVNIISAALKPHKTDPT